VSAPEITDPRLDPCPEWCTHHRVDLRRRRRSTEPLPAEYGWLVIHRHIVEPIKGCTARVVIEQYVSPKVAERQPPEFVITTGAARLDIDGAAALAEMIRQAMDRLSGRGTGDCRR
jgi:hypothetical protein